MAERHLVVDHLKLSYEGLFNADELYSVISSFFFERGWDWFEKINEAHISSSGKQIRIVLEPWKNISDFYKLVIAIKLHMQNVKEVEVQTEEKPVRVSQGIIKMTIDGYVVSDRKGKWHNEPVHWFLGVVLEKYFFKDPYRKAEMWLKSEVEGLHSQIKTYLNTFKYTYGR
ncbi:MAG: hypothetical protein AABW48_04980 [Nanoarchaeota archaeon]